MVEASPRRASSPMQKHTCTHSPLCAHKTCAPCHTHKHKHARTCAARSAAFCTLRLAITTLAPLAAAPKASARPAPPAPTTTTVLPLSGEVAASVAALRPVGGRKEAAAGSSTQSSTAEREQAHMRGVKVHNHAGGWAGSQAAVNTVKSWLSRGQLLCKAASHPHEPRASQAVRKCCQHVRSGTAALQCTTRAAAFVAPAPLTGAQAALDGCDGRRPIRVVAFEPAICLPHQRVDRANLQRQSDRDKGGRTQRQQRQCWRWQVGRASGGPPPLSCTVEPHAPAVRLGPPQMPLAAQPACGGW